MSCEFIDQKFVVKELLDFYHHHDGNAKYQRDTLAVWAITAKSGDRYAGAYKEAVRRINGQKPN